MITVKAQSRVFQGKSIELILREPCGRYYKANQCTRFIFLACIMFVRGFFTWSR